MRRLCTCVSAANDDYVVVLMFHVKHSLLPDTKAAKDFIQNMFYINKVPVYNPSHLFGFFSSFSPDIVKDFRLYKSNIPAEYGGRLASYFDISTRDGNRNRFSMRGGISPVTGHVAVEGQLKRDESAFVLSARSTYSDWILKRLEDPELRTVREP